MPEPTWSRYDEAYKAIHDKLPYDLRSQVQNCDKIEFAYDAEGDLFTLKFYDGANLLLTLTFNYDAEKKLTSIVRS